MKISIKLISLFRDRQKKKKKDVLPITRIKERMSPYKSLTLKGPSGILSPTASTYVNNLDDMDQLFKKHKLPNSQKIR